MSQRIVVAACAPASYGFVAPQHNRATERIIQGKERSAKRIREHVARMLEHHGRLLSRAGGAGTDAIYIDDAMGTSDVISPAHYERFCLPYVREMVREIHNLGHKAIVIYFGGVADRLDLIASTGADGLSVETTMKNYVNDIDQMVDTIGGQISLFGNLDPIRVLEQGTEERYGRKSHAKRGPGRRLVASL